MNKKMLVETKTAAKKRHKERKENSTHEVWTITRCGPHFMTTRMRERNYSIAVSFLGRNRKIILQMAEKRENTAEDARRSNRESHEKDREHEDAPGRKR